MSQKLLVDGFKWIDTLVVDKKLNKLTKLIKSYDDDSDKGYMLEVDIKYPNAKNLYAIYMIKNYVVDIKTLQQAKSWISIKEST